MGKPVAECPALSAHKPEATGTAPKSSAVKATDLVSLLLLPPLLSVFCPDPVRASQVTDSESFQGLARPTQSPGHSACSDPLLGLPSKAFVFSQKSTHVVASFWFILSSHLVREAFQPLPLALCLNVAAQLGPLCACPSHLPSHVIFFCVPWLPFSSCRDRSSLMAGAYVC